MKYGVLVNLFHDSEEISRPRYLSQFVPLSGVCSRRFSNITKWVSTDKIADNDCIFGELTSPFTHSVDNLASQRVLEKIDLKFQEERIYFGMECKKFILENSSS
jgi:hypothetical protein